MVLVNLKNLPAPLRCQRPEFIFLVLRILAAIVGRNADVQSCDLLFFRSHLASPVFLERKFREWGILSASEPAFNLKPGDFQCLTSTASYSNNGMVAQSHSSSSSSFSSSVFGISISGTNLTGGAQSP